MGNETNENLTKIIEIYKNIYKTDRATPRKAFRSNPLFLIFVYKNIYKTWKRNTRKAFRSRWVPASKNPNHSVSEAYPQCPILFHFRPSASSKNGRWGDLESNALVGIEFGEFRQKLKNVEFRKNSSFW